MNESNRLKYLRIALWVFGLVFIFGIWPLAQIWPSGWTWHDGGRSYYLEMIMCKPTTARSEISDTKVCRFAPYEPPTGRADRWR